MKVGCACGTGVDCVTDHVARCGRTDWVLTCFWNVFELVENMPLKIKCDGVYTGWHV